MQTTGENHRLRFAIRLRIPRFSVTISALAMRQIFRRILGLLLHLANCAPHFSYKSDFYELKTKVLERYGVPAGKDVQEIRKGCWSCGGTGWWQPGIRCQKCGFGTAPGLYRHFLVDLDRWLLGGYTFHVPRARIHSWDPRWRQLQPTIVGYIQHPEVGLKGAEAALWLALIFDPQLFATQMLKHGCFLRPGMWPMLSLQRLIFQTRRICGIPRSLSTWWSRPVFDHRHNTQQPLASEDPLF